MSTTNEQSDFTHDVFISYVKEDEDWVDGFLLDALESAGIMFLTEEAFRLGAPRLDAFEEALRKSKRVLLVLSKAFMQDGANRFENLLAQSYGAETNTWPVIPLILEAETELPFRLRFLVSLDATEEKKWETTITRLIEEIGKDVVPPPPKPPPPYPGMRAFEEEDSGMFYGREDEVEELLLYLRSHPFRAVIGPSGSGKSSLVCAGLIPALRKSELFGAGTWLVRTMRPKENPLEMLEDALGGDTGDPETTVQVLLSADPEAMRLLLVIDQLEELFTVSEQNVDVFQERLLQLSKVKGVYIVLTARADFYSELMATTLWPAIQRHRYELTQLGEEALAEAIVRPADDVDVHIQPTLVERLVADAGGEPGLLPFVQETMILLWGKLQRRYLPLSAYSTLVLPRKAYGDQAPGKLTGLRVAIVLRADAAMDGLSEKQQITARRILVRLVQFGVGRPDTRRQQTVKQLLVADEDLVEFNRTLEHLTDPEHRLLILSGDVENPDRRVDIAHEALIGAWPVLQGWLAKRRNWEQIRRRLEADVHEWLANDKDPFYLYGGTKLEEVQRLVDENPGELDQEHQEFLEKSEKQDEQRKRVKKVQRGVIAFLALIGLIAIGLGIRFVLLNLTARGPMVTFEAGPAWLGYDGSADERSAKAREMKLDAFSIDKHEVSNGQYRKCVQAWVCTPPVQPSNLPDFGELDAGLPVVYVSAYQASDFCRWIGRHLPTEAEWERAARGEEGRIWPWAGEEDPTSKHANVRIEAYLQLPPGESDDGSLEGAEPPPPEFDGEPTDGEQTPPELDGTPADGEQPPLEPENTAGEEGLTGQPVAIDDDFYRVGNTPEDIMHLLGNVYEWTSTPGTCGDAYNCPEPWDGVHSVEVLFLRGTSFDFTITDNIIASAEPVILTISLPAEPSFGYHDAGFRCADN